MWIVKITAAVVVGAVVYYAWSIMKNTRENMVAEFYGDPHRGIPSPSHTGLPHYALWIVPGVQPSLSSVVRKYGGYHIKLMNMQPINLPSNFSLDTILQNFPTDLNHRWNMMLPDVHVRQIHTKNHLAIMVIDGASTLNLLRKFFQTKQGGSWKPLHFNSDDTNIGKNVDAFNYVTLGSDDPYDQAKPSDFTYQTQWYVQLVKGPNFEWISNQRVLLHTAQGYEG